MAAKNPFDRLFRRGAAEMLMQNFAEEDVITYYDRDGSAGREIKGLIERDSVTEVSEFGVATLSIVIRVRDNVNSGISATEVDTGGDYVAIRLRPGDASTTNKRIKRILSTSGGMVRLSLE